MITKRQLYQILMWLQLVKNICFFEKVSQYKHIFCFWLLPRSTTHTHTLKDDMYIFIFQKWKGANWLKSESTIHNYMKRLAHSSSYHTLQSSPCQQASRPPMHSHIGMIRAHTLFDGPRLFKKMTDDNLIAHPHNIVGKCNTWAISWHELKMYNLIQTQYFQWNLQQLKSWYCCPPSFPHATSKQKTKQRSKPSYNTSLLVYYEGLTKLSPHINTE